MKLAGYLGEGHRTNMIIDVAGAHAHADEGTLRSAEFRDFVDR
jgi:hypothetical protein